MNLNMEQMRKDADRTKEKGQKAATSDPTNFENNLSECLHKSGNSVKKRVREIGRWKFITDHCPFDESHTGNDSAFFLGDDGKPGYKCFHDSCSDKTWKDAARLLDFPVEGRTKSNESDSDDFWEPAIKTWPVMAPEAFQGLAGEFVKLATINSEADPVAVLVTFLIRFGIEAGDSAFIQVGDAYHPARDFVCIAGASSMSRKGTSAAPVDKLFDSLNSVNSLFAQKKMQKSPGPLSTGEGIIYSVRDPIERWEIDKRTMQGRWIIVDPGVEDKRLYVQDEEFASALQCTKREGNTLSTTLRGLWDKGNAAPLTKSNKISTTGAHVGIVTHITIPELKKLIDEVQLLNGFGNRFLWVLVRRNKVVPFPEPMPDAELSILRQKISEKIIAAWNPGPLSFDPDAHELWAKIYSGLSSRHSNGLVGALLGRDAPHILRLSLIYALLDGVREIRIEHLHAAMAVWEYVEQSVSYIFDGYKVDEIVNRIYKIIEKHAPNPVSASEIHEELGGHVNKGKKDNALNELIASGKVLFNTVKTGGRPKEIFSLAKEANLANKAPAVSNEVFDIHHDVSTSDMNILYHQSKENQPTQSDFFKVDVPVEVIR